jgi:hypothetical protein
METSITKSPAQNWLEIRQPEINLVLKALYDVKSFTVGNPAGNLNLFHTTLSSLRETQDYVRTYLLKVIGLESEVKRSLGMAIQDYKDAMGKAFTTHKVQTEGGRSLEEKSMKLREFLPEIKIKEEWEDTLESVKLLKEAVDLVYQDLSKNAMSLNLQVAVLRNQILTGEIRIAVGDGAVKSLLSEATSDSMEKAAFRNKMVNQPNGEFNLDELVK